VLATHRSPLSLSPVVGDKNAGLEDLGDSGDFDQGAEPAARSQTPLIA